MTPEQLRKKAKKKVEEKKAWYLTTAIFAGISVILVIVSLQIGGYAAFWIRFPIIVLAIISAIMYVAIFGLPFIRFTTSEWEEEQIQREMNKVFRNRYLDQDAPALPPPEDLTEKDRLELKELERLKEKWDYRSDDFV